MRLFFLLAALLLTLAGSAQKYFLLIGSYTNGTGKGIYVYQFDAATGKLSPVSEIDSVENPSFLTLSRDGRYVYAVNETGGDKPGGVSAFSFDTLLGRLHFLNKQPSGGDDPCYVSEDASGKWVTVANYGGGNLSVFPVAADGSLRPYAQLIQHEGQGANPKRQEKAHVHSVVFTPDERFLLTPDLGLDRIYAYDFHSGQDEPLSPDKHPFLSTKPGSGPRHIDFSPDHRFMYVIEELSGEVLVYGYAKGEFTPVQTIPSVMRDTSADKGSADIHVSPDGRFLYTSNRGITNNLTIYEIHPSSGKLKQVGSEDAGGTTPRNFSIDPEGHFLLVANQNSNNVVVFRRDVHTGLLTPTGDQLHINHPVCLKWWPR